MRFINDVDIIIIMKGVAGVRTHPRVCQVYSIRSAGLTATSATARRRKGDLQFSEGRRKPYTFRFSAAVVQFTGKPQHATQNTYWYTL